MPLDSTPIRASQSKSEQGIDIRRVTRHPALRAVMHPADLRPHPIPCPGRLLNCRTRVSSSAAFSNASSNSGSTAISAAWWAPAAVESTLTKSKSACPRAAASATAGVHQVLEDALGRPRPEPVVDGGPRTVLVGHVPPWAARAEPPHHRVELPPQIRDRAPLAHRQMGLDQGPLVVCEVTTRHARCPTRAGRHRAGESTTS